MPLFPVDDALSQLLSGVERLPSEAVPLEAAAGRILAGDVASRLTQPPFDASAMDGYAARSADTAPAPVTLALAGVSAAGAGYRGALNPGEAIRILTGAPVPSGADTVVIQENVTRDGDHIRLEASAAPGANIRPKGGNIRQGEVILRAGRRLVARDLMLAASAGHGHLDVVRRPRVAILATGDELVPPGVDPGPDQIVSSNSIGLAALVSAFGGAPLPLGIAPDSLEAIATRIRAARDADIVITSGGVSVGDHDQVKPALASLGMTLGFWKIAMRPGKPLMVGRLERFPTEVITASAQKARQKIDLEHPSDSIGTERALGPQYILGLPGNPVSAMVTARIFLVPLMRALQGLPPRDEPVMVPCVESLPTNGPRQHYMRAILTETPAGASVAPLGDQDSSLTSVFAKANALVIRTPDAPGAAKGTLVPVLRLDF